MSSLGMVISLGIDMDEALLYANDKLGGLTSKAAMAVRTAANRTAKDVKKENESGAKKTYTDRSELNEFEFQKASVGNLEAVLKDKGGSVHITRFTHYVGSDVGISGTINRNRGHKKFKKYGNKLWLWNNMGMVRKTAARYPVEAFKSVSSPSAHGSDDTMSQTPSFNNAVFAAYLEEELEKAIGRL